MDTPVHAHPSDGSYYPVCARCRIERAAPELLSAAKLTVVWYDNYIADKTGNILDEIPELRAAIAKAEPIA